LVQNSVVAIDGELENRYVYVYRLCSKCDAQYSKRTWKNN